MVRLLAAISAAALVAAAPPARADRSAKTRASIVSAARERIGQRFPGDCSGFVLELLAGAHVRVALPPARSRSESLFLASRRAKAPRPGDLAFFHHTYDRDRDGRANDPFTHVALVEAVRGPAVLLVHRGSRGIERIRMDLTRPTDPAANDPVRRRRSGDPPAMRTLAGDLFAAYGTVVPR